ncbi:MAG TPA: hypothetical protein PLL69_08415, partial [Gemmatimonadales bacterium]|nr:hypothetical protein [Gemmatimonadales bacterium]
MKRNPGRIRRLSSPSVALAAALCHAPVLASQQLLVVTGLSGEPGFAASFELAGASIVETARRHWGLQSADITWLAEDPAHQPGMITARASAGAIDTAISRIASRGGRGETVVVVLIGHGSGSGAESRLSIPGRDPTAAEYGRWLVRLAGKTVVFVVAASGSGDFVPVIAAPGRIVITATRSSSERNESLFASRFAHGLASLEADADKDGKLSILEAFSYADREVAAAYSADNRLRTEHAVLQDGSDGSLARRTTLGRDATADDPRAA